METSTAPLSNELIKSHNIFDNAGIRILKILLFRMPLATLSLTWRIPIITIALTLSILYGISYLIGCNFALYRELLGGVWRKNNGSGWIRSDDLNERFGEEYPLNIPRVGDWFMWSWIKYK